MMILGRSGQVRTSILMMMAGFRAHAFTQGLLPSHVLVW